MDLLKNRNDRHLNKKLFWLGKTVPKYRIDSTDQRSEKKYFERGKRDGEEVEVAEKVQGQPKVERTRQYPSLPPPRWVRYPLTRWTMCSKWYRRRRKASPTPNSRKAAWRA